MQRLTKAEFVEREKVSVGTLDNWVRRHGLPVIKIGTRVYVDYDEFEQWLKSHTKVNQVRERVVVDLPPPSEEMALRRKKLEGKIRKIY